MPKEKISALQFFTMLFISRALTTLTYLSSYTVQVRLSDMIIQPIFRVLIGVIITLPVYIFYKRRGDISLLEQIKKRSKLLSKGVTIIYCATFFYFTVMTVARLDLFAGTVVFPETDVNFLLVAAVICCAYGAFLGFEPLGRSAVLSAFLVVPAIVFIVINLTDKIDLLNLSPLFYNGVKPVLKTAMVSVGETVEYAIIAIALPKVSGKRVKGYFIWLVSQTALMGILFFFASTVMGNFAGTQLFPFHTLASLAGFSMFDRLDAIFTGVWILGAFIKAALLIYLQADLISNELLKIPKKLIIIIITAVTIIVNLYISEEMGRFSDFDNASIKIVLTTTTAFLIPLLALFLGRSENKCEKQ